MRVLIGCERFGRVRDAFRARGHDAWSCDLVPSEGNHIQADVLTILGDGWDLMIAHPDCTHLAVSGARYFAQKRADGRQQAAIDFFMALAHAPIPKIGIENPVCIMSSVWRKPDQIIQPYQFGHPESKTTCLWLKDLPLLRPTNNVSPPHYVCKCGHKFDSFLGKYGCPNCEGENGAARAVWANQTPSGQNKLSPSPDRAMKRSQTYLGIAQAMADQWGGGQPMGG